MSLARAFLLFPNEFALKLHIGNIVVEGLEIQRFQFSTLGKGANHLNLSAIVPKMGRIEFEFAEVCGEQHVTAALRCDIDNSAKCIYFDVLLLTVHLRGKLYEPSKISVHALICDLCKGTKNFKCHF